MTCSRQIRIVHKNDLSAYLGDWKNSMNMISIGISKIKSKEEAQHYRIPRIPKPFESFSFDCNNLSVMLTYLDAKLRILEETPITPGQFNYQAYSEARVFLTASYIFLRILLDDCAGIIGYFYKNNKHLELSRRFGVLLNKANEGKLPKDLSKLLQHTNSWFPEMRRRRVELVHNYDSILISFERGKNGKNILGHFSTKSNASSEYEDIRQYFGFILCEYQRLIDNLLDHFDAKFGHWYGIHQGESSRTTSIIEGGIMLWWAYKYGNYRHKDLQVIENNDGEVVNETI